jgi:precorrin-2 dehydrogenase/sirohydrochlorin ferrochelatase
MMEMEGRRCVVVGAGTVGLRRAATLAQAGADVLLVAPDAPDELEGVEIRREAFSEPVLEGARFVLACTDDPQLNEEIARLGRSRGALVNRSDEPGRSDFHMPMYLQQGPVTVAISTGGASPTLSRRIRDSLTLPPQVGQYASELLALRERAKAEISDPAHRSEVMQELGSEQAFMLFLGGGADSLKSLYEMQRNRNHKQPDAL